MSQIMSFLDRDEIKELNVETRASADGSFIQLPNGVTHYELSNPENNSPLPLGEGVGRRGEPVEAVRDVVFVHGFSVPYFIFDPTFKFLTESGFRVLRYDHFGRGLSDRPRARYNLDLFVDQLSDLLDALRLASTGLNAGARPVSLIALSMGGPIASAFTLRHPERVDKLVLIDPVGARPIALSPALKAAKIPFVAEAILGLIGGEALIKNAAKDFFDPAWVAHFISQYRVQMQYKGFKRAILSTLRNNMLDSFIHVYEALGKTDKPVLLFWGRQDTTVPFEHSDDLRAALPKVQFHAIDNCGHIPHYEKPDEVNPILLEFLA